MASAGRILIMPKGNWDANTEYEMLDLVFHNETSWLAKKNNVGIEPAEENAEYWFLLCESKNLDEVNQRLAAIENQLLSTITLDDIPEVDLSGYATKAELSGYATKTDLGTVNVNLNGLDGRLDVVEPKVTKLVTDVASLTTTLSGVSGAKFATGTYTGTGETSTKTISFGFAPKLVIIIGLNANGIGSTSTTILIPDTGGGNTTLNAGSMSMGMVAVTKNGNNVTMTDNAGTNLKTYYVCNSASFNYTWIAIG